MLVVTVGSQTLLFRDIDLLLYRYKNRLVAVGMMKNGVVLIQSKTFKHYKALISASIVRKEEMLTSLAWTEGETQNLHLVND